jgi:hypothetical protein
VLNGGLGLYQRFIRLRVMVTTDSITIAATTMPTAHVTSIRAVGIMIWFVTYLHFRKYLIIFLFFILMPKSFVTFIG